MDMYRYILLLIFISLGFGQQNWNIEFMKVYGGLMYSPNSIKPYTGKVYSFYEHVRPPQKEFVKTYKDGERNGLQTDWYENGQKSCEVSWKDGKKDGVQTEWYENGTKKEIRNYLDGVMIGSNIIDTITYTIGLPIPGFEIDVTEPRVKPIDGSTLVTKDDQRYVPGSEKPYSGVAVIYYENGEKKEEGTYKDGKKDGLWTGWYKNGGIIYKGGYENGQMNELWIWWHDNGEKSMERTFIKGSLTDNWSLWKKDGSIYKNNSLSSAGAMFQISNCYRQIDKARYSIKLLNELLSKHQKDIIAPKAQYFIGDIYMNDLRDFIVAIQEYRKVIQNYSGSEQEPHALFMIGYIYANVVNDPKSAEIEYGEFLKSFPNHELAPSVKFEIDFLGKGID